MLELQTQINSKRNEETEDEIENENLTNFYDVWGFEIVINNLCNNDITKKESIMKMKVFDTLNFQQYLKEYQNAFEIYNKLKEKR